jgi:gas vesicle protein
MTSDERPNSESRSQEKSAFSPDRETESAAGVGTVSSGKSDWTARMDALKQQEADLKHSIADLQSAYNRLTQDQFKKIQSDITRMVQQGTADLEQRKRTLQMEIEQLERRQERIQAEMRTTFAGTSQDLAVRVQGFKDYLVGSLQDLAAAAEQLPLTPPEPQAPAATVERAGIQERRDSPRGESAPVEAGFASGTFQDQTERIRSLLDQYRMRPDYYGPVWQLRRTFEPIHAERVSNWFFAQGGRGAVKGMGSRLQNVLVASAAISILNTLYGNRLVTLVLSNTPERLGEWRRGLQDCLGVSRADFGTGRGLMLFDAPEPMAQRAERVTADGGLPLIIVDEAEAVISLSILQFPLWLAFAPDPLNPVPEYDYF